MTDLSSPSNAPRSSSVSQDGRFATTQWSLVLAAGQGTDSEVSSRSLAQLCETYWYPLYSFVRRSGRNSEDAKDLTQAFFAFLLEKQTLAAADAERGRFRSFLLTALKNFLANQHRHETAEVRGGNWTKLSLDFDAGEARYSAELPARDDGSPEKIFDRRWAMTVLEEIFAKLEAERLAAGKQQQFEVLKPCLVGGSSRSYQELASELGMSETAVKVAVHRLRTRFGELLRAEILETVAGPEEVEEEVRAMITALGT